LAIYRSGELIPPRGQTVLEAGDHVFLISTKADGLSVPLDFISREDAPPPEPLPEPLPESPAPEATERPPEPSEPPPS
jgi:hypothetical protein